MARNEASKGDPLRDLDPSLREYFKSQTPTSYETQGTAAKPSTPTSATPHEIPGTEGVAAGATENPSRNQSLFQDGRYDHLWKTYKPKDEVEALGKSDQEKLMDILMSYKDRNAAVKAGAMENCAEENWNLRDCFINGSWSKRMVMCRDDTKELQRCIMMQARFLRALGYLGVPGRSSDIEEQIQLHADALYHRMLDQEKQVAKAKEAGTAIPEFPALMPGVVVNGPVHSAGDAGKAQATATEPALPAEAQGLKAATKSKLRDRLSGLTGVERALEEQSIVMGLKAGQDAGKMVTEAQAEIAKNRQERRAKGKSTVGDFISGSLGW